MTANKTNELLPPERSRQADNSGGFPCCFFPRLTMFVVRYSNESNFAKFNNTSDKTALSR